MIEQVVFGVLVFTSLVLVLVFILNFAESQLLPQGDITIEINGDKDKNEQRSWNFFNFMPSEGLLSPICFISSSLMTALSKNCLSTDIGNIWLSCSSKTDCTCSWSTFWIMFRDMSWLLWWYILLFWDKIIDAFFVFHFYNLLYYNILEMNLFKIT